MNAENQPVRTTVSTVFSQPADGLVQFNVSVKVDMREFAGWAPERITAFFGGIAQVLAAKGSIEKVASEGWTIRTALRGGVLPDILAGRPEMRAWWNSRHTGL